jgi:tricorn protease
VKAGDFIVAVDGKPTDQMTDIYAALVGKAGKQVTLRVSSAPKTEGAHDEVVVPTGDEQDYPQLYKEALIVDVRGNGGGKVSPQILERLRREPAFWTIARNGAVGVDPSGMVLGPKVLLLDQFSASDGDIVAYRFKKYKLGPVIGLRSWGGVVGIRGSLPLLDGGYLNRPEFSRFDLEAREWIMEGKGVEPDIVVDNDPAHEYAGIDDQLNRAIDEIKSALARNPVRIPQPPPYPDKRQ